MVAGSECHLRVDDDIIGITRLMFVEGGADDAILADADRLEIVLFPFLVPVLAFHQCFGKMNIHVFQWKFGKFVLQSFYII